MLAVSGFRADQPFPPDNRQSSASNGAGNDPHQGLPAANWRSVSTFAPRQQPRYTQSRICRRGDRGDAQRPHGYGCDRHSL